MSIISISGKIGSGKDTIARIIQYLTANGSLTESKDINQIIQYLEAREKNPEIWEDTTLHSSAQFGTDYEIKKFAKKLKIMVSLLTGIPVEDLEKQEVKDSYLGEEWDIYKFKASNGEYYYFGSSTDVAMYNRYGYDVKRMTVRELLQKLGTEALRDVIHPNVHVNALFADYSQDTGFSYPVKIVGSNILTGEVQAQVLADPKQYNNGFPNWIISDLRFTNEAQAIQDRDGLLIRVNRYTKQEKVIINKGEIKEHPSETALDDYKQWDYIIDNDGSIEELVEKVREILKAERII